MYSCMQWIYNICSVVSTDTDLADEDGEKEVVDEEGFGAEPEVVAEEEVGEGHNNKLLWSVGEATAKHFQTTDDHNRCCSSGNQRKNIVYYSRTYQVLQGTLLRMDVEKIEKIFRDYKVSPKSEFLFLTNGNC